MDEKQTYRDELREIAPELADIDRQNPFRVPPGYFRELPDRIMARIAEEERQPVRGTWLDRQIDLVVRILRHPQYALALASLTIVLAVAAVMWLPNGEDAVALDITTEEAFAYVMNNIDSYEAYDLMALDPSMTFAEVDLMDLEQSEVDEALEIILDDIDDATLEEYY